MAHICVLTVKDLQGQTRQRHVALALQAGQAALARVRPQELTDPQKQVLTAGTQAQTNGPADAADELTILRAGKPRAVTVAAHNGQEGQVTSTTGALTFRTGDFFTGRDREQVRITPEGQVGIGTDKPEATLDVAGTVRARDGIVLADGTVLKSAADFKAQFNLVAGGATSNAAAGGQLTPAATGAGTQGRLPKWTDNAGTLGDSVITETANGNVGISNQNPTAKFSVSASPNAELRFDQGIAGITPVLSVISSPSSTTQGGASILGAGTGGSSFVFSDNLPFFIVKDTKANVINNNLGQGTALFTLLPTGSVGIGTTNPQARLEVAGNIKLSGVGNGIMFPDGSTLTSARRASRSAAATKLKARPVSPLARATASAIPTASPSATRRSRAGRSSTAVATPTASISRASRPSPWAST
jgi:hypothetical protein